MEQAAVKIQAHTRGYLARKETSKLKNTAQNTLNFWKFQVKQFPAMTSTGYSITLNYFESIKEPPKPITHQEKPVKSKSSLITRFHSTKEFSVQKKPLITFYYKETKISPSPLLRPTSSTNSFSKPASMQVSPIKKKPQLVKSEIVLFTSTLKAYTKPIVPMQHLNSQSGKKSKKEVLLNHINEAKSIFENKNEPECDFVTTEAKNMQQTAPSPEVFTLSNELRPMMANKDSPVRTRKSNQAKPVLQTPTSPEGFKISEAKQIRNTKDSFDGFRPETRERLASGVVDSSNTTVREKMMTAAGNFNGSPMATMKFDSNMRGYNQIKSTGNFKHTEKEILKSPYESVWPRKILKDYYNLELAPDSLANFKRFKLVKISRNRTKKAIKGEVVDKYVTYH